LEKLEGRNNLEDLGVDGRVVLEWIIRKYNGEAWTGCVWFRIGTSGRPL
jgi:hypothetical protein